MIVEFVVTGDLPPKKDGANSMWYKETEARRLIALRKAAYKAFGNNPPFDKSVILTLEIQMPGTVDENIGDLDNFVTGVCDGLMVAHPRSKFHQAWQDETLSIIHPLQWFGLKDDRYIVGIHANKKFGDPTAPWYRVVLESDLV